MDHDDGTTGYVLSRRDILALAGAAGYTWLAGTPPLWGQAPAGETACVVRPEQTEGPYFVDDMLNRSDLRPDPSDGTVRPGTPLALTLVVSRLAGNACEPLRDVQVDLWQCDHLGIYSDVQDPASTPGEEIPARLPYHRPPGAGEIHDHLPRLVSRSYGPYSFQAALPLRAGRVFAFTSSSISRTP